MSQSSRIPLSSYSDTRMFYALGTGVDVCGIVTDVLADAKRLAVLAGCGRATMDVLNSDLFESQLARRLSQVVRQAECEQPFVDTAQKEHFAERSAALLVASRVNDPSISQALVALSRQPLGD